MMFGFLRKRLANKIMIAIIITITVIMVSEITFRIYFGTKDRIYLMVQAGEELASSTYAGIKYPMSIGDADGIRRQLAEVRELMKDVVVFICDFDQQIIYSTHEDKINTKISDSIFNKAALLELSEALTTGGEKHKIFEDIIDGKRYLIIIRPIMNNMDCYHCHGSSRKILGSLITRMNTELAYTTVTAQRNRTLLLIAFTLPLAIFITFLVVNKFIRRPVESLAEKAKSFAEGDMSVSVDVKTEDEIGILGKTFNYMVESVSTFSKKLEREVTKKTILLDERNRFIALLEKANRELRELDKLKSSFLANMSHELRTPMNAIIGYTDLLLDGVDGPINEEQEKSLKKVTSNAKHLLQLINDVLDVSKIESGKTELQIKEIDLKELIESVIPTFEYTVKQNGLTITINIDDKLPPVYGDEDKVKQIIINLLSNAVKFTPKGGITISVTLSEKDIKPGDLPKFAEICIEDTGIGIKDEDINKIFDKFTQVDVSTIRQYEGTGLGLNISRGLVALHKGFMWVESKYGEGSRFCFTLPLKKEIFEKLSEPAIDTRIAESLAEYFGKPVETFLAEPTYGGRPMKCWEYIHCGQLTCPAHSSKESRCWLTIGTHCEGMKIAAYPEKVAFCKGCEVIGNLILDPEDFKSVEAETQEGAAKKTILAIDDNPEAIDIIRKYLGENYRVVGILSSEIAMDKVKKIKPAAITLDIMMPNKDGWQLLRELKESPETQDIPVIILSIIDNKNLGFSLGAADYIVKPVNKNILLRKLKKLEKTTKIKKILAVDNDQETIDMIGNVLKEAGYQMARADNSKDAIKTIKDFTPDLIVLNLTIPVVDGFDVIKYLKTEEGVKDIPLIVITNKDLTEKEIDELNGRIQGILNKVVLTKEGLLKEIKATINKTSVPSLKQ